MPTFDEIVASMTEEQRKKLYESLPGVASRIIEEEKEAEAQAEQDRLHKQFKNAMAKVIRNGERHKLNEVRQAFRQRGYVARELTDREMREIQNGREEE